MCRSVLAGQYHDDVVVVVDVVDDDDDHELQGMSSEVAAGREVQPEHHQGLDPSIIAGSCSILPSGHENLQQASAGQLKAHSNPHVFFQSLFLCVSRTEVRGQPSCRSEGPAATGLEARRHHH